jgi:hypothetical protein
MTHGTHRTRRLPSSHTVLKLFVSVILYDVSQFVLIQCYM